MTNSSPEYKRNYYRKNAEKMRRKMREWLKKRRDEMRAVVAILKNVPCADCRGRFPACAMDFDHVSGKKELNVANMKHYPIERIIKEIEKCEVVCANCHRIRTWTRKQNGPGRSRLD